MVGKAFKIAFAQSKFPEGSELKLQPMNNDPASGGSPGNQGRRWVSQPKCLDMGGEQKMVEKLAGILNYPLTDIMRFTL